MNLQNTILEIDCSALVDNTRTITNAELDVYSIFLLKDMNLIVDNVTINLPTEGVQTGNTITFFNESYNLSYYGAQVVFGSLIGAQDNNSFWFFFEEQINSFVYTGVKWVPLFEFPNRILKLVHYEDLSHKGFVNIAEYNAGAKQALFSNINMGDEDYSLVSGRFFREGSLNVTQEDALQNITGYAHVDTVGDHTAGGAFTLSNANEPGSWADTEDRRSILDFDASRVARTADETRPKNIQGYYVVKCW